jgi:hypothetical protein
MPIFQTHRVVEVPWLPAFCFVEPVSIFAPQSPFFQCRDYVSKFSYINNGWLELLSFQVITGAASRLS